MIRITADIDNTPISVVKNRVIAILMHLNKKEGLTFDRVKVRYSSSGLGCHVILWSNDKISKNKIFYIRYLLGDDVKRIKRDMKGRNSQHLFFKKKFLNDEDRIKLLLALRRKHNNDK